MNALAMRLLRRSGERLGPAGALRILDEVDHMLVETLEGQAIELGWMRDNDLALVVDDYLRLVLKKTAWYSFIHPLRIGAIVADENDDESRSLRSVRLPAGPRLPDHRRRAQPQGQRGAVRQGDRRRPLGGQADDDASPTRSLTPTGRIAPGWATSWRGLEIDDSRVRCSAPRHPRARRQHRVGTTIGGVVRRSGGPGARRRRVRRCSARPGPRLVALVHSLPGEPGRVSVRREGVRCS